MNATQVNWIAESDFAPYIHMLHAWDFDSRVCLQGWVYNRLRDAASEAGYYWFSEQLYSQFGFSNECRWQHVITGNKPVSLRAVKKIAAYLDAIDQRPQHLRDGQTPEQRRAQFHLIQGGKALAA